MRLDLYLANNSELSRSHAANLIALGLVNVNGKVAVKAALDITESDKVEISGDYDSSLGSLKLIKALNEFNVRPEGKICLDVGASNGGFTDILLKNGAKSVYALDVGECALSDSLRTNPSVIVMDNTNARFIKKSDFAVVPQLAVIDVSFISLTLILSAVKDSLSNDGEIIALIKPQFECSKRDLSKKGILIDKKKRLAVIDKIKQFSTDINLQVLGVIEAPHPFEEKNQEYLIYLKKYTNTIA